MATKPTKHEQDQRIHVRVILKALDGILQHMGIGWHYRTSLYCIVPVDGQGGCPTLRQVHGVSQRHCILNQGAGHDCAIIKAAQGLQLKYVEPYPKKLLVTLSKAGTGQAWVALDQTCYSAYRVSDSSIRWPALLTLPRFEG